MNNVSGRLIVSTIHSVLEAIVCSRPQQYLSDRYLRLLAWVGFQDLNRNIVPIEPV